MDFSYYLFTDDITNIAEAESACQLNVQGFTRINPRVTFDRGTVTLYVREPRQRVPVEWTEFVHRHFDVQPELFVNQSSAALIFLSVEQRVFAVPFGQGRFAVAQDALELDFGVTTTLNVITGEYVTDVELTTPGRYRKRTAISRNYRAPVSDISRGNEGQLLDKAGGSVEIDGQEYRIAGRDSLRWKRPEDLEGLFDLCSQVFEWYRDSGRRDSSLAGFEAITPIKNKEEISRLDTILYAAILSDNELDASIDPPMIEDHDFLDCRAIFDGDEIAVPQDIDNFRVWLREMNRQLLHRQKRIEDLRLKCFYSDDTVKTSVRIKDILSAVLYDGETYAFVLSQGRWSKTPQSLDTRIKQEVEDLITNRNRSSLLPAFSLSQHRVNGNVMEGHYNEWVSASRHGWSNWDIPDRRYRNETEVCDILTIDHAFIHVKRRKGFDQVNYVCGQASAASDRIVNDDGFQRFVLGFEPSLPDFTQRTWPRDGISFMIALVNPTPIQGAKDLSFNARHAIKRALDHFRALGVPLYFACISEIP